MTPQLLDEVVQLASKKKLLPDEHFSVDGTHIQAWVSHKSFRRKDDEFNGGGRNADADVHREKRTNETHESKTDGEALMDRKGRGKEAKFAYMGHTVMENRNGLVVKAAASQATGTAERYVAVELLVQLPGTKKRTVGADKGYDTKGFVAECRAMNVTPHVARNDKRKGGSPIDGRTRRHAGYSASQIACKGVEEPFGWGKTIGLIRQVKVRNLAKVNDLFMVTMMGWNLKRMANLQGQSD